MYIKIGQNVYRNLYQLDRWAKLQLYKVMQNEIYIPKVNYRV